MAFSLHERVLTCIFGWNSVFTGSDFSWAHAVMSLTESCLFLFYFMWFKLYKYQKKTTPTHLFFSERMTLTQEWPERSWALLQLLLVASFSQAEEQVCQLTGDPENSQLSKDGDIILGGMFAFHGSWKDRKDTYTRKPLTLECTR